MCAVRSLPGAVRALPGTVHALPGAVRAFVGVAVSAFAFALVLASATAFAFPVNAYAAGELACSPCSHAVLDDGSNASSGQSNLIAGGIGSEVSIGTCSTVAATNLDGERKYVMIGDSYATFHLGKRPLRMWPRTLAEMLGVDGAPVKYKKICKGGSGFAAPKHRFLKLIKKARRDTSVTDVIIIGGAGNDLQYRCSKKSVAKWYKATIKLIRKKYPNARIVHGVPNWNFHKKRYRTQMTKRVNWYKALARKHGVIYLHDCEQVLRKHRGWMQKDGNHPNQRGTDALCQAIANELRMLDANGVL